MAADTENPAELLRELFPPDETISGPAADDPRALLERGRYAVTEMPDGSWAIVRAGPLCETCQGCGCGEQQEPIFIPAMVARMLTGESALPGPLQKMLGRFGG